MSAAPLAECQDTDERAALEAIAAALGGSGSPEHRLNRGLAILRERLRVVRGKAARTGAEPGARVLSRWPDRPPQEPQGQAGPAAPAASVHATPHAGLVGESEPMRLVYGAISRVSHSQATVLLRGESGTGKELAAKAIHLLGPRAGGPFVRLHCAVVTETLLESELFGHERGAFTGAVEMRRGRFELADGGTLFLDEIGDIPLATQVKLLRVLQERSFERVGGSRAVSVDVRLISATHRDLEAMVRAGIFREDLYYRLNVVPITLPPLRERGGDIPLLIAHFLSRFNRENHRQVKLAQDLLRLMVLYDWPGNVRELQNCVERVVVMAEPGQELVTVETIPASLRVYFSDMRQVTAAERGRSRLDRPEDQPLGASLQEIERRRLQDALERAGWIQAKAARALGLTPRQVAYKVRKYGLRED